MIPALVLGDRAYCGRDGCRGRAFGVLQWLSDSQAVAAISFSPRWTWLVNEKPPRWRRAANVRTRSRSIPALVALGQREAGRWTKDPLWQALPAIVECPACRAVNEVTARGFQPNADGVESEAI